MPPEQVDPFIAALDPAVGRTVSLNGSTEDVTGQLRDLDAQIENRIPDKSTPIVVLCAGGVRSAFAAKTLGELGYGDDALAALRREGALG